MGSVLKCLSGTWFVRGLVLAFLLLMAPLAQAQAVKGRILSVGIGGNNGKDGVYREGSWIPVQVEIKNVTPAPLAAQLGVTQLDLDGDRVVSMSPEFILEPGVEGRKIWTYYWPRTDVSSIPGGITEIGVYDKSGPIATLSIPGAFPGSSGGAEAIMPDADVWKHSETAKRSARFVVVLGDSFAGWKNFDGMWGGTEAVKSVLVKPDQLPDRALGLDGVDVIVWEADSVRVTEIAPDFQLKAILDWVRSGGHLIVSVGAQGQEFLKAPASLQAAMPLTLTGASRDLKPAEVMGSSGMTTWRYGASEKLVAQALGELKAGSHPVTGLSNAGFADHPLAVTGVYGRGAVTVVTVNVSSPEFRMTEDHWIAFWSQIAGWQNRRIFTADAYKKDVAKPEIQREIVSGSREILIGQTLSRDIDVKDVTAIRIGVALLFLAFYWLLAGPVGHLILRYYRVVHWSWWIFGATVLAATVVASVVVFVLHVSAYDVRHQSFVLGTVNSHDVTVNSFYGVYAPSSGPVRISQPLGGGTGGGGGGLNYLAPLCVPMYAEVKSFADPQGYDIATSPTGDAQEVAILPVFRNTLKKMQGRWTGQSGTVEGSAEFISESNDLRHLLKGSLTNNSGYDLAAVEVLVYLPRATPQEGGSTYMFHVLNSKPWKQGQKIDLLTDIKLNEESLQFNRNPSTVERMLQALGWRPPPDAMGLNRSWPPTDEDQMKNLSRIERPDDLLYFLLDARRLDDLDQDGRYEPLRGFGRLTDCTKVLHAACGLIVARAADVKSPVPLKVNDQLVAGTGLVRFAWGLPVAGKVPAATTVVIPPTTGAAPAAGRSGGILPGPEAP